MKKTFIFLLFTLVACSANNETANQETVSETSSTINPTEVNVESTSTTEIVQLDSFAGTVYVIQKDESRVGYLAPKQFLNSGLETVEGTTSEIIGEFTHDFSSVTLTLSPLQSVSPFVSLTQLIFYIKRENIFSIYIVIF